MIMISLLKKYGSLVSLLAFASCNSPSLELNVSATGSGVNLTNVSRYRVLVRQWCDDYPAVAEDVSPSTSIDLATAVIPGEDFYVWVQAWEPCINPPNICPDEVLAADDECRCVDANPKFQKIVAEGCTPWLQLASGQDSLDVSLGKPTTACPPVRNEACP